MYHVTPFTYLVEALVTNGGYTYPIFECVRLSCYSRVVAGGGRAIRCAERELVSMDPPSGQTCGEFLGPYIEFAGGYLTNANDEASCHFCPVSDADTQLFNSVNMSFSHRWRDVGFLCAYIVFNVSNPFR